MSKCPRKEHGDVVQWEWQKVSGDWHPFIEDDGKRLEVEFNRGRKEVKASKKRKKVNEGGSDQKRRKKNDGGKQGTQSVEEEEAQFQSKDEAEPATQHTFTHKMSWNPVDDPTMYKFDFGTMIQINTITSVSRKIRRQSIPCCEHHQVSATSVSAVSVCLCSLLL